MSMSVYPRFYPVAAVAAAVTAVLCCSPVLAATSSQTSEKQQIEHISVKGSYSTNEQIDTATGLGLSLLETPQSVSVITAQRIIDQQFSSLNEVIARTVGLSVQQVDSTRNTFNARGFDIDKYQLDGVPLAWSLAGDAGETQADVALYERIEVVRGATGLLTGAGDPSASVNLVRKHANATELTGYLNAGVGSWNNRFVTADVGSALTSGGAVRGRLVAKKERGDTFMTVPTEDKTVLYGVLDADLTDSTQLSIGSSYQDNNPTGSTWGGLAAWFTDGSAARWDRKQTSSAPWTYWQSTNQNHFATLSQQFSNGWIGKISYNKVKNAADTKLLYVFGTLDKITGEGLSPWPYQSSGINRQRSLDVQLKGDFQLAGRTHDFVIGGLTSRQSAQTDTFAQTSALVPIGNFYQWDYRYPMPTFASQGDRMEQVSTEQDGYYLASRFELSDALKLIAGGRLSSWQRAGFSWGAAQTYGDDSVFVPYIGALYQLTPVHNIYLSQTEIFKPQNAREQSGQFIDPVTGINRELGVKSAFADGAVQTSVAVFEVRQDNLAQSTNTTFPERPTETIYRAADGTRSKGFELEVIGQLSDAWKLSAGYAQFSAEDANGLDVNTEYPRKKLDVFSTYDLSAQLSGLELGAGISWQARHYSGVAPRVLEQGAYALVNLMARYTLLPQLSLQLNVNNLFDKTYASQIGFFEQYAYGTPREFTLGMTYSF